MKKNKTPKMQNILRQRYLILQRNKRGVRSKEEEYEQRGRAPKSFHTILPNQTLWFASYQCDIDKIEAAMLKPYQISFLKTNQRLGFKSSLFNLIMSNSTNLFIHCNIKILISIKHNIEIRIIRCRFLTTIFKWTK